MNFGNKLSLSRKERIPQGIKAERTHYSVTYNPSTLQSGNMLLVKIPTLAQDKLIVPGSIKLVFNINITGDTNSWFVNNLSANLIERMEIKWGTKFIFIFIIYFRHSRSLGEFKRNINVIYITSCNYK